MEEKMQQNRKVVCLLTKLEMAVVCHCHFAH